MDIRLGLCSAYSLLYGVHKPGELLDRAVSDNIKTVSICDLNNLYGVHDFLEAAKERNIRPIIGAALTINKNFSPNSSFLTPHSSFPNSSFLTPNSSLLHNSSLPIVYCFVENRAGFGRLCGILTERNKDKERFNPLSLLKENSSGLTLASCDTVVLRELAGHVKSLYAAITADNVSTLAAAKSLFLPLAFLDTSLFLDKSDFAVHRALRAIALNKTIGSLAPHDTVAEGKGLFKTSAELRGRLDSWPQAARGTAEITEACQFSELFDGFIFPAYGDNPGEELRRRVFDGAVLRYGELGDMEIDRIEYELQIIEKMGFPAYFLRMDDIVKMAAGGEQGGSRTCGRGSAAASIVSYSLGITNVDPIAHNLYFERFLNPARPDPPDIDVDFAWDERDELIKSVISEFGPEYCARVANHNFFRFRSALRETSKAYGFSDGEITQLERKLSIGTGGLFNNEELGIRNEELGEVGDPLWREIFGIAKKIEGLPRGLSMHCGGLVITPKPVSCYAPVEKSLEGYPLLAWEKEGAEAAGFVKIDLLGNRSLAVIRDAVKNIEELGIGNEEMRGRLGRAASDAATVEALARGDTMGVFYIESPAMRQLQKKTRTGDFDHIVIHSSIIRPAANKFISEYVRRLKGEKWTPLHPRLEHILGETYGILCYQEDVSKTAAALAGFSEADADKLRKVIAKKRGAAKLAVYENLFFEGCRENAVPLETIQKIWSMMLSFDGYSFCKPHSASYAMVSFQSAYLRVHHPAEFMAAVLSNQGGYYRPGAYISECRRMGLVTTGPDINISLWKYCGISNEELGIRNVREIRNEELGVRNGVCSGTVVIGLMAVKGLSASGAQRIVEERKRAGEFKSLDDFSRRVKPARDDIIALCPAGVFDSIAEGLARPLQARRLLSIRSEEAGIRNTKKNEKLGIRNEELFESEPVSAKETIPQGGIAAPSLLIPHSFSLTPNSSFLIPNSFPLTPNSLPSPDLLWEEYRALGFLRNVHPLALWKNELMAVKDRVKALRIGEFVGRNVKIVGWPVTQKEVWTKDGLTMSFLSLEDETAMYETVIFPQIYERYNKLLFDQRPLLIYGRVTDDQEAVILEVEKIEALEKVSFSASKGFLSGGFKSSFVPQLYG